MYTSVKKKSHWIFAKQSWSSFKHNMKWHTKIGSLYRKIIMHSGLFCLYFGRFLLRKSLGRCSWCGLDPGMSSSVSKKGLRCNTLDRNCEKYN